MSEIIARPFLKWAGGKTQLLTQIEKALPPEIYSSKFTYIEPFVGSGAVLFWMLNNFPNLKKAIINDVNGDLINSYKIIASNPKDLISILETLQREYHELANNENAQKEYYYKIRNIYNERLSDSIKHAAYFIFLNKSGFNGIYRVNKNNLYNVPKGSSSTPPICDKENIIAVSNSLKKVDIMSADFESTINYAGPNTFFYFDPPYKPLSKTSSFTAYSKDDFGDTDQIRLRDFCNKLDKLGYKWMLSNSDLKGKDLNDNFFDEIYSQYIIARVKARRSLNAHGDKRGELNELLITNYTYEQALQPA